MKILFTWASSWHLQESLRKDFGSKTGDMLWNYSRGIDNRLVGVIQVSQTFWLTSNCLGIFKDLTCSLKPYVIANLSGIHFCTIDIHRFSSWYIYWICTYYVTPLLTNLLSISFSIVIISSPVVPLHNYMIINFQGSASLGFLLAICYIISLWYEFDT